MSMWKRKEDDARAVPLPPVVPTVAPKEVRPVEPQKPVENFRADVAHIGKSVVVKGELSGSEDLYLDGEVEGSIELKGHSLIIGPHGRVRANVHARDICVHGKVDGNLHASERVELKKSAVLAGDILTQRIIIEDGAYFKGGVDLQKVEVKEAPKDIKAAGAAASAAETASVGPGPVVTPKKF